MYANLTRIFFSEQECDLVAVHKSNFATDKIMWDTHDSVSKLLSIIIIIKSDTKHRQL